MPPTSPPAPSAQAPLAPIVPVVPVPYTRYDDPNPRATVFVGAAARVLPATLWLWLVGAAAWQRLGA
jgi:hypothetical protein